MGIRKKFSVLAKVRDTFGFGEVVKLILRKMSLPKIFTQKSINEFPSRLHKIETVDELESWFKDRSDVEVGWKNLNIEYKRTLDYCSFIQERHGFFDSAYDMGDLALHAMVGIIYFYGPKKILETGVAAGKSSAIILSAIALSKSDAKLVSTDITEKCGILIPEVLKVNWDFRLLRGNLRRAFRKLVQNVPELDMFIHDSNHSIKWENFEVETVFKNCPKVRFVLVDDVHPSICEQFNQDTWDLALLMEPGKLTLLAVMKN